MRKLESRITPVTTRSRVAIEIAAELVALPELRLRQAKILLREQGQDTWPVALFGSSTIEGIHEVVAGTSHLAMINPAGPLNVAYLGKAPFAQPQPIRTIATIPSLDTYVFAVKSTTGLRRFEDIGLQRYPLRLGLRGQSDHCLHFMLDHITAAAGFSVNDIVSWGGYIVRKGLYPSSDSEKMQDLIEGRLDALFDEAADEWVDAALDAGMNLLTLGEPALIALESLGYRRSKVLRSRHPKLTEDIATIDFSGWPIFVHSDLPDKLVASICAALDARKHLIPWQGEGPLPVHRMCVDSPDTPLDVPLHPAAAQFWRDCGYLK